MRITYHGPLKKIMSLINTTVLNFDSYINFIPVQFSFSIDLKPNKSGCELNTKNKITFQI